MRSSIAKNRSGYAGAVYFLRFFCSHASRSTFFIASGEHQIVYIVHSFLLAFFVELVEGREQRGLPDGKNHKIIWWASGIAFALSIVVQFVLK